MRRIELSTSPPKKKVESISTFENRHGDVAVKKKCCVRLRDGTYVQLLTFLSVGVPL